MHRSPWLFPLIGCLLLAACSGGGDVTSAPSEVDADLPDSWETEAIDDEQVGSYLVSAPADAARWEPGGDLAELTEATAGTDWGAFWLPQLEQAALDSNIRRIVTDTSAIDGEVVSWQVNVTPRGDDGEFDDPRTLAGNLADGLAFQGLEIEDAGTTTWADQTIATVSFRVPEEVFGGDARFVRQWFFPRTEPAALWSLSCDGPNDPGATEEICAHALDGFRPTSDG